MKDLSFRIEEEVAGCHPDLLVGAFRAGNLGVAARACAGLDGAFEEAGQALEQAGITRQNLVGRPEIAAWRAAIGACGLKASRHRGSVEQLARRILRDGSVQTPLPLVSLYCAVSAQHLTPLGAYDVERLPESVIALRPGDPESDIFLPLGAGAGDMPVTDRVIVYACGSRVICWAYNVRDSRESCLTAATSDGVFLGEAVDRCQHDGLRTGLDDLRGRLARLGAVVGGIEYFDRPRPGGELSLR